MSTTDVLLLLVVALCTTLVMLFLVPMAHQASHAIAARQAGLRIVDLRIQPLQAHRTRAGRRTRLLSGFQGVAWGMLVDPFSVEDERLAPALARFARAGTAGLSAYILLGFALIVFGRAHDASLWAGVAVVLLTVLAATQSLIRPKSGLFRTDGWAAQTLERSDADAVSLVDAARINYFTDFARARPREYPPGLAAHAARRWADRDVRPGQRDESLACGRVLVLVHLDRGEWVLASAVLDGMVEVGTPTPGDGRHLDWVHLHRAIVRAIGLGDPITAEQALRVVKPVSGARHLSLLTGARSVVALSAGRPAEAAALASRALEQTTTVEEVPGQIAMQRELWHHVVQTAAFSTTPWVAA